MKIYHVIVALNEQPSIKNSKNMQVRAIETRKDLIKQKHQERILKPLKQERIKQKKRETTIGKSRIQTERTSKFKPLSH